MTREVIEKIYCEVYGHVNCDLSPQFEEFLVRLGVKIDEPEEKIENTRSQFEQARKQMEHLRQYHQLLKKLGFKE